MEKNHLLLIAFLSFLFSGIGKPVAGFPFAPKMDSIQIVFDDQQLILPGESFQIGIISYYKNGKIRKTVGMEGGSAWWWGYKVEVSGGYDFGRYISVNEELVPSKGKYIGIKAYPRKQPELMKELLLPLNYETKITYRPAEGFDKAPGSQIKGELVTEFNNGSQRFFTNLQDSMVSANFQFYGDGGSWKNGEFTIEPDFLKIEGHRASLIVNSLQDRSVTDTFSILLDYKHAYNLQLSGSSGMSGARGFSDYYPSPGKIGNYYNGSGSDGQNGQNGEIGSDGPDIDVWVDLYRDSVINCDLLYVYAQNSLTDTAYRYLVNPDGGSLTVNSQGGSGGDGGDGGRGDDGVYGKSSSTHIELKMEKRTIQQPVRKKVIKKQKKKVTNADGKEVEIEENVTVDEVVMEDVEIYVKVKVETYYMPGEPGGPGGWGGAGGLGGVGGYGGNITLYFTDDARPYQHLFVASSIGGLGGMHGSGGIGGSGGSGGHGNPDGNSGTSGQSGLSAIGWADRGQSGQIIIKPTQEFFFYTPKNKL